jgi:predicted transcriptional regulator
MKIYETLERIGLPESSVKIYLALLEYGHCNPSDIARHADMHRTDVYRFLPLLEDRRLVTRFLSGKRTLYRANDPKHLKEMLTSLESRLDIVIENLQEKQQKVGEGIFEYGRGADAIRSSHEQSIDAIPLDSTIYRYSSRKRSYSGVGISPEYEAKRKQKRIYRKLITNEYQITEKIPDPMREIAVIPESFGLFDYDITKSIVGDTVKIVDYETLEIFIIRNRQFAEFEKKLFELLFPKLKKI